MKTNKHGGGSGRRVSAVGPCDVLLGRGTGPNENQGNKLFRDILKKHKEAYRTAETKREKRDIVMTAIGEFKAVGGRFLEKVVVPSQQQQQSSSNKHCYYEVVDGPAVCLKARQAFRYLLRGVEIDNDHKEQHTPSTAKSMLGRADVPLPRWHRRLLPTFHSSTVEQPTCEASSLSMNVIVPSSQVENDRNIGDHLTSREDDLLDISRLGLASLVSEEAPIWASSLLGNTSRYCPTTSPWGEQERIPLSLLRLRQIMSDAGTTSPSTPEMLVNAIRFLESWPWATTDHANTHGIPGSFLTNEIIGHHCGQYPTISDISQIATSAKRLDSLLQEDLLNSPTTTTNTLISSQYSCRSFSDQSKQEVKQSRITSIDQPRGVIARALIEHRLQKNRLAALVIPDLQRIMMINTNSSEDASLCNPFLLRNLEKSHVPRHGGGTRTFLHQIMTGLPGDSSFVFSK